MKKKFNINDDMYIQITEAGWKHLKETVGCEYIKHCIASKYHKKEINNEVWYKLQCHEVFTLLPIKMGRPVLFNSNVLFNDTELIPFDIEEL